MPLHIQQGCLLLNLQFANCHLSTDIAAHFWHAVRSTHETSV